MTMRTWQIKTSRGKLEAGRVRQVWARFGRFTRPHRWALVGAFAAAWGVIATQLAAPWPIKIVFDYVLSDKMASSGFGQVLARWSAGPQSVLIWVCAAVLVIAAIDAACSYVRDVLLARTGQRVVARVRQELFAHLQTLPPSALERRRTGELLMRLTGDIIMLRQMLVNSLMTGGQSVLTIAVMMAAMFWLNPVLAALGIALVPLTLWATWRISHQIRRATKNQREKESEVASIAHDVLGAMAVVQAFNREDIEKKRFSRQNRSSMRAGLKTTRLQSKLYRMVSLASAAGMCAILYVGVRSVLAGAMTAGDLLVFVSYLRALNKPMRQLSKLASQVAKSTACGERVAEIFAITPAVRAAPHAKELERARGGIRFAEVSFLYGDGTKALSDVSFEIAAGEHVAVIGHTGAGKSTLAKLLLRFHDPQEGDVYIDDLNLRDLTPQSIRRQIGWVHQDTILFGMTVGENISLGRPDADSAAVRAIARRVCAHEFIKALPNGYATVLGQGGHTLSGGQRQRLALARALLREPAILLLDEPATGLDAQTRQHVERAWARNESKVTTLVICHRLTDMDRFDRIMVLQRGRLVEIGRHDDLVSAGGEYAAMVAAARSPGIAERAAC